MGRRIGWLKRVGIIAFGFIIIALAFPSCSSNNSPPPVATIVVAYSPFESTGLLWIAEEQQFFDHNGLDVSLRKYDTGSASLTGVLNGEADISIGASEFPVVRRALQKDKLAIIGNADKADFIYLVGRKDRGITQPSDLKGKKVGTAFGTIAQFFLGRFLGLNGLKAPDVTIVDLKTPAEWVDSVSNGDVDAVAIAQPDANAVKELLGNNAFFWPVQSEQLLHGLIVSTDQWLTQHPDLVNRFLKSMYQAEEYVTRHPAEAKAIIQKRLNLDTGYMDTVWSQNQFGLSLDQSLIAAMEDEARWLISNNMTSEKQVPNFNNFIYEVPLKAVKPMAVKIIR